VWKGKSTSATYPTIPVT